jgi:hypothetical protein
MNFSKCLHQARNLIIQQAAILNDFVSKSIYPIPGIAQILTDMSFWGRSPDLIYGKELDTDCSGEGFVCLFPSLCAPTEPYFDKTWVPGDVEKFE